MARACEVYRNLIRLIHNNLTYFNKHKTSYSESYVDLCRSMLDNASWIDRNLGSVHQIVPHFDISADSEGNGLRTWVSLIETEGKVCFKLCRTICLRRDCLFFRPKHYRRRLQEHSIILRSLRATLSYLIKYLSTYDAGELFADRTITSALEWLEAFEQIQHQGLYGRSNGFWYCESMRKTLRGVNVIMASFSDLYQLPGGAITHAAASVLNGGKYMLNPELRAQQIVYVAQNASVEFLKAFWSLSETHFMKNVPNWLCPTLAVREEIYVPAEAISIPSSTGEGTVVIPVPSSHIPEAPVRCRLLSYTCREGQISENGRCHRKVGPLSPCLLIHCHGGGFIAQTPESHEIYLRDWAKELDVPVLSIDYSLAPEAPFPRALEEILLVYAWVLVNCHKLGSTGERICFVGDSAGGNLVMALTLKTIDLGIRKPDGIFCAYTPMILDMVPSPSRMLSAMDPLLPLGFMLSCLNAYVGTDRIQDDEYCDNEIPAQGEKTRKISAILDSGIQMLKELEKMDIEGEQTTSSAESSLSRSSDKLDYVHASDVVSESKSEDLSDREQMTTDDYVTEFTNKYMVTSNTNVHDKTDDDEHLLYDFPADISYSMHRRFCRATRQYWDRMSNFISDSSLYQKHFSNKDTIRLNEAVKGSASMPWYREQKHTLAKKFQKIKVVMNNPFISPFSAPDEMLQEIPPVYLMSAAFDPCLDDSVMFGRRLKSLGKTVHLDILEKLPHGFLNFSPFSKEANDGSKLCAQRLREILKPDP